MTPAIHRQIRRAVFVLILSLSAAILVVSNSAEPASAGPPYVTDDPEPADYHSWEVYVASAYTNGVGTFNGTLAGLDVNYGLAHNIHVMIGAPINYNRSRAGALDDGPGDLQTGVKYRFLNESFALPQVAIYPSVSLPTGQTSRGLGAGRFQAFLPLWAQKSIGSWTIFGGGGVHVDTSPGHKNWSSGGAVLTDRIGRSTTVGAELYMQTADTPNAGRVSGFTIGFEGAAGAHHALLFSVGRAIQGSNAVAAYAAYETRVPSRQTARLFRDGPQ